MTHDDKKLVWPVCLWPIYHDDIFQCGLFVFDPITILQGSEACLCLTHVDKKVWSSCLCLTQLWYYKPMWPVCAWPNNNTTSQCDLFVFDSCSQKYDMFVFDPITMLQASLTCLCVTHVDKKMWPSCLCLTQLQYYKPVWPACVWLILISQCGLFVFDPITILQGSVVCLYLILLIWYYKAVLPVYVWSMLANQCGLLVFDQFW